MTKNAFNYVVSALLAIGLIISMLFIARPTASAADEAYAEDGNWMNTNPNAPSDYAYSIAVVGDTQSIVKKDLANGTDYMSDIYSWLAANGESKKIQYVLGVGDITEYTENFDDEFDGSWTYDEEWEHAKAAITLLDDKIPYSLCRGGGHDTVAKFNEYFASHEYYTSNLAGTYADGDVTSSYSLFEVGGVEYLILALDWNPSDAILEWAGEIVSSYPERNVILTTHAYLAADGTLLGSQSTHSSVPSTNDGVDIYDKLVSKYDNIQLVFSGHCPSQNLVYKQDARESGSVVTSLLVDPQTFDSQNEGETGMVCMLYFSEDGSVMTAEWFSTVREQYYKEQNQFSLELDRVKVDGNIVTKYGSFPESYADGDTYPFLLFVDGEFVKPETCGTELFNYASGTMERYLRKLSAESNAVVILQSDVTVTDSTSAYLATNYTSANLTIDLMGHTVTNVDNSSYANLFASNATQTYDTNLTVKNGKFVLAKGLLTVSTGGGEKTQSFTFEDLEIVTYYKELLIFNQYKTEGNININLIGCDIISASDSQNPLVNAFRAGNSGDTTPLMNAKTTVKGCTVTFTSFDQSKIVQQYNGSAVVFEPDENGEALKVIIPEDASISADTQYSGSEGESYFFVKSGVGDGTLEYSLMNSEDLKTAYGDVPAALASPYDYPFIAFVDGEAVVLAEGKTYDLFNTDAGEIERTLRSKNTNGAVVILRRDFTVSDGGMLLTNYQQGTLTVDLMGYTVDATAADNLFASNGTQTFDNELVVKNGRLILGKGLASVSTHTNAPDKKQTFTFENLDITTTYSQLVFHNKSLTTGEMFINYVDCDVTSDNLASHIFAAGKSATDTNIVTHITVTGGSLTLKEFNQEKAVQEFNGGSVVFLPNSEGEYLILKAKSIEDGAIDKSYTTGAGSATFNKAGEDGDYGVYLLRDMTKMVTPKLSLTLHSGFTYNVYVPKADFIISVEVNGSPFDLEALDTREINGTLYYHLTVDVGVLNTADAVELAVISDAQRQSWTTDVISYAATLATGEYGDAAKTLAGDILAYIRAAYVYANTADAEDVKAEIEGIIGEDYEIAPDTSEEAKQSGEGISGSSLYLTDTPVYVFYPETDEDGEPVYSTFAYKFTVGGKEVTAKEETIDGKLAILVYPYASEITETVSYSIEGTDITGEYNLAAYLSYTETLEDENLVALVLALWQYSDSAKAYIASVAS